MLFMYFRLVKCPRKYITVVRTGQPMAIISRQTIVGILGTVMIVSLALTIVAFPVALIWIGQPAGNAAITMADVFATVFSVAFFTAFLLAMTDQRRGGS